MIVFMVRLGNLMSASNLPLWHFEMIPINHPLDSSSTSAQYRQGTQKEQQALGSQDRVMILQQRLETRMRWSWSNRTGLGPIIQLSVHEGEGH